MKKCKWILLAGVAASYFVSSRLPVEWGWENSPLEWSQVLIFAVGLLLNLKWRREVKAAGNTGGARLLAWIVPAWPLGIGRELSWGRVFFVSGLDPVHGPEFFPLSQLPFGRFVHPLLAVIIVAWLFAGLKYALYKIPWRLFRQGRFPMVEVLVPVIAITVAQFGEHHLGLPLMEEIDETFAYLGVILFVYCLQKVLKPTAPQWRGTLTH